MGEITAQTYYKHYYDTEQVFHLPGAARRKVREMLAVYPNSSVAVKTMTVWSSVPNLPMSTIRGRVQFSASPPSNEHVTDTTSLVNVQSNVCRPPTPLVPQTPSNTVQEAHLIELLHLKMSETPYLAVVEEIPLQFVTIISVISLKI